MPPFSVIAEEFSGGSWRFSEIRVQSKYGDVGEGNVGDDYRRTGLVMATGKKNAANRRSAKSHRQAPASDPNAVTIIHSGEKSREAIMAEKAYGPTVRSLAGSRIFINNTVGEQALTESLEALNAHVKEVQEGNLDLIDRP